MMRFLSRLGSSKHLPPIASGTQGQDGYESVLMIRSKAMPWVTFAINRISFGRRMDLSRRAREISKKAEFLDASNQLQDKIDASILAQEVDAMYLTWGLVKIEGLTIDGEAATAELLIERGPDEVTREIVGAIKAQCGLSDAERKN